MRNGQSETKIPSLLYLDNTVVVGRKIKRRRDQMPTNDGFSSDQTLPSFLRERTWKPDIAPASDLAVFPLHVRKAIILVASVTVFGIATFSVGNPKALLASLADSFGDKSASQPLADQSNSTIQTTVDVKASSSATKEQPTGGETAATAPAAEDQAKIVDNTVDKTIDPQTEALFRQFLAWAAEKDAPSLEPVQPVQDDQVQPEKEAAAQPAQVDDPPAKMAEDAGAALHLLPKHRRAPATSNARAEMQRQAPRKMVHRPQRERAAPARAAVARDRVVQNAAPPPLLPQGFFGSRD
jgi:hypothetical protein